MAKQVGQMNKDTGRVETRRVRRATEIPWTPGPKTRWQKIKRAAVG